MRHAWCALVGEGCNLSQNWYPSKCLRVDCLAAPACLPACWARRHRQAYRRRRAGAPASPSTPSPPSAPRTAAELSALKAHGASVPFCAWSWPRDFLGGKNSFRYGRRRRRCGSVLQPSPRHRRAVTLASTDRGSRAKGGSQKHLQLCAGKVRLRRLARPTHGTAVRDDPSASSRTSGRAKMRRQRSPKPTSNRRSHISAQMPQLNCATPACDREFSETISRTADSMVQSAGPKSQWIRSSAGLFRIPFPLYRSALDVFLCKQAGQFYYALWPSLTRSFNRSATEGALLCMGRARRVVLCWYGGKPLNSLRCLAANI